MTSPSIVRTAVPADEESLMALCTMLHGENAAFTKNDDKVRYMLHRAFARDGVSIGVIGPTNAIEGAIILMISSFWYTSERHLEELFNYVHPDHRRSNHAKALLKHACKCSDELKIPLNIGVMSGKRTAAKINLYRKTLGTYPIGAFFLYGNRWAKSESAPEGDELFFWDNPFPRSGVKVIGTKHLSKDDRDALSRICKNGAAH